MAKNNNLTDFMKDIADSLRTRLNSSAEINPQDFSDKILTNIEDSDFPGLTISVNSNETSISITPFPNIPSGFLKFYSGTLSLRSGTTFYNGVFKIILAGTENSNYGLFSMKFSKSEHGQPNYHGTTNSYDGSIVNNIILNNPGYLMYSNIVIKQSFDVPIFELDIDKYPEIFYN